MKIEEKKLYLGIEILRMIFAFIILFFHCMNEIIYSNLFIKYLKEVVGLGLTIFFIISFYFSYNSFSSKKINKIKERFKRLLVPYIIWPIIIYFQKILVKYISGKDNGVLFKFFIYQILIGNGIYSVLWFNFNLIFISLLFAIIIFTTKKYMIFLFLFGIMIIIISFSYKYNQFWDEYNDLVVFPLRPITSTYLHGLIGFFLSSIKIFEKNNISPKYLLLFILFTSIILIINNNMFFKAMLKNLFSVFLILIFTSTSYEKLKKSIYTFIKLITSYTGGIYYIHIYINSLLKNYVSLKLISGNIFMSIIHYFLCYFICLIGSKLFKNNILKFLFI